LACAPYLTTAFASASADEPAFFPVPLDDMGACGAPYDDDAALRTARIESASAFLRTPFQIGEWVEAQGKPYALDRLADALAKITTPAITQTVYETGSWSGRKFVEYQFLSSAEFNGGILKYLRRECEPGKCEFVATRTMDARATVSFEFGANPLSPNSQNRSSVTDDVERSMLVFENCSPRIEHIYTDLAPGMVLSPEEHYSTVANTEVNVLALCLGHMIYCPAELAEYVDVDDCVERMRAKPGVCYDLYLKGDTVDCRALHLLNARVNPTVHCPHMAPESEVCQFDDCPAGYCGYRDTRLSADVISPDGWQQAGCAAPLVPVSDPFGCVETCVDDALGVLPAEFACGRIVGALSNSSSLCETPLVALDPTSALPPEVMLGTICPSSCGFCAPKCAR